LGERVTTDAVPRRARGNLEQPDAQVRWVAGQAERARVSRAELRDLTVGPCRLPARRAKLRHFAINESGSLWTVAKSKSVRTTKDKLPERGVLLDVDPGGKATVASVTGSKPFVIGLGKLSGRANPTAGSRWRAARSASASPSIARRARSGSSPTAAAPSPTPEPPRSGPNRPREFAPRTSARSKGPRTSSVWTTPSGRAKVRAAGASCRDRASASPWITTAASSG